MQDRPSARELLEAVEQFLERDVVSALEGPKQFHARVAANVMRILARELCERIRHGDADAQPWRGRVLAHVRQTVEEKLAIAKPEMINR